ncbi:hypothetical protein HKX48_001349 [Thoreauomyces humboldtii]|nr:hypothetical protein HKX48_001349 [Thoreauomyces humboldtii]
MAAVCDKVGEELTSRLHTNFTAQIRQLYQDCASNTTNALTNQASDSFYNFVEISWIAGLVLHVLVLGLLGERITSIKHKPTIAAFTAAVTFSILLSLWDIIGNITTIPWLFGYRGTELFYYTSAILTATAETSISALLYLRVYGKKTDMAGFAAVAVVGILEFSRCLQGAIKYTKTDDYDQNLYDWRIVWTAFSYKIFLDVVLSAYSLRIVHQASHRASTTSTVVIRDDAALLVAYLIRMLLFLTLDVVRVLSYDSFGNTSSISIRADIPMTIDGLLGAWKPYLIITDVARIRAVKEASISVSMFPRRSSYRDNSMDSRANPQMKPLYQPTGTVDPDLVL